MSAMLVFEAREALVAAGNKLEQAAVNGPEEDISTLINARNSVESAIAEVDTIRVNIIEPAQAKTS